MTLFLSPQPEGVLQVTVEVTHRVRLSAEDRPCRGDPGYSLVRCMEEAVTGMVGCRSPWNLHEDANVSSQECAEQ